ncbi:hypothetical protein HAX54_028552, partial [Datura stramonium]|nr:hypothetical protein [Datura stramonium]
MEGMQQLPSRRVGMCYAALNAARLPRQNKVRELGAGYIFNESERFNLTLVRELYSNRDTSFRESTKVNIIGQVVRFTAK